ncbi:hypothetical protein ACFQZ2_12365 [Streptomonospora algeriensis]|uniref:Uncharacterized protein n=1 Tax=Streptomonospora algeriensis TaxID=995084 RepID=A0ABW3BH71_9ACTN
MPRPITFEPRAARAAAALPSAERAELAAVLDRVAAAGDPFTVLDPYIPDPSGPLPFHGAAYFGADRIAVVSLYVDHLRVISVRRNT